MRHTKILTEGWRFRRGDPVGAERPEFDGSNWEAIRVPHDWAISGPFDRDNDVQLTRVVEDGEEVATRHEGRTGCLPHVGVAWYRLELIMPGLAEGDRACVEFDGVMSHSTVYCNGKRVGGWPYGYTSFVVDVTGVVLAGRNVLAVRVDNPPNSSRWYPGAGIYRHVRLIIADPIRIAHRGTRILTSDMSDSSATVEISTCLENSASPATVAVETEIRAPGGRVVAKTRQTVRVTAALTVSNKVILPEPELWSAEHPALYNCRTTIRQDGDIRDQQDVRFGVRSIEFDATRGFVINGRPDRFNGVCLHHDLGPLGAAVNVAAIRRQLRILKDMGCNAIRTAHNPPAAVFLDLCDEIGFYVIDEAFDEWRIAKCDNGYHTLFDEWAERDLRAMIARDRNHPCVVMWSLGNEVRDQRVPEGATTATWLNQICHDADPTRPTTAAFHEPEQAIKNGLAAAVDIPGWNYEPNTYSLLRQEHPEWPIYGSETASCLSSRGEYYLPADEEKPPSRHNLQVNSFDLCTTHWASTPDQEFSALDENPTVMGEFVWTGFDYLGEPTPYATWPSRSSYFGIVDLGGIPKSRYWLYKSRWSHDRVLYIHPHWTWPGVEGQAIPVHCYTNCASVELFVNGVSYGRRDKSPKTLMNRHRIVWPAVAYEPGELRAVGYDEKGQAVEEATRRTAGSPARVVLHADRQAIAGNGVDMVFIHASVRDSLGVIAPNASNHILFSITGPGAIEGVCNGDPTDLHPLAGNEVPAFHGECVAYVRSTVEAGRLEIRGDSKSLEPGVLSVEVTNGDTRVSGQHPPHSHPGRGQTA